MEINRGNSRLLRSGLLSEADEEGDLGRGGAAEGEGALRSPVGVVAAAMPLVGAVGISSISGMIRLVIGIVIGVRGYRRVEFCFSHIDACLI